MKKSLGAKTVALPVPVWIVGTYDGEGKPNAMAASWAGICCSKPPCVSVALREATYTHGCIRRRQAFTVSVPGREHAAEADYFGLASGRDVDKFEATGLTPVRSEVVDAPYVAEFPLVVECRLYKTLELGLHTLFVGEILDVKAEEAVLDEKGLPDAGLVAPFVFSPGSRRYHALGEEVGRAFRIGKRFGTEE
jgi:flavin reductase (DIM6/NTAB) family NADH-FMN oxidoreductase RutF